MDNSVQVVRKQVILAALLHDIGKFYQRADAWLGNGSAIDDLELDLLQDLVPFKNGKPTYQHAIWTYQFFLDHQGVFEKMGVWKSEAANLPRLAAKHHQPKTELQHLVALADQLSSGIDRRDRDPESPKPEWGKYAFRHTPLRSIFGSLNIDGAQSSTRVFQALRPLDIEEETVFPRPVENPESDEHRQLMQNRYKELWTAFSGEFVLLPTDNFESFLLSLQHLLWKYSWCIPSSTTDHSDVSLYEHLKSTAGIADCLHTYFQETDQSPSRYRQEEQADNMILLCLDLSGIQSFIYDINSKKAFKSLKGRSFYVETLAREMVSHVIERLSAQRVNILYQSGGKAFVLLPNTQAINDALPAVVEELEQQAFHQDQGKIFPAVGYLPFHYRLNRPEAPIRSSDLGEGKALTLGDLWKGVSERAADRKRRRFDKLLLTNFEAFFSEDSDYAQGGELLRICAVTGEPITQDVKYLDRDREIAVLPRVYRQTEIGRKLKDATAIHYFESADGDLEFSMLDRGMELLDSAQRLRKGRSGYLLNLNDTDFLPDAPHSKTGYGFQFYGGNRQPLIQENGEERPKTFEELCLVNEKKTTHLGVLRMDVDNLGQLFIRGFKEENKSFAAYATLSTQLDLFFSGYLNTLREEEEFRNHVAILYAGGDDLFAIGRWDRVAEFAEKVRSQFTQFVGRDDLSISAGLVIVHPKFPIYKAADLAQEAELAAKNYVSCYTGKAKNALCIFGLPISWTEELPEVVYWRDRFVHLATEKRMASSILHRLREAYTSYQANQADLSYKWQTAYFLQRFAERYKKDKAIKACCEDLKKRILHDSTYGADRFLALVALAARWAEYLLAITKTTSNG